METTLFIWFSVVALMITVIVAKIIRASMHNNHGHRHLLEMGSEREEFWVPGDPLHSDADLLNDDN